ncbi:hypothetical protein WNY37_16555 [Henriciella sp. AS95]|uniref:hypothetical protein n=1 Tax=Henriciella sp. AS95 TaxID=3135782 RepID=UPI00318191C4
MLDWPTIQRCHQIVPVQYWPVLWFYLACLRITLAEAWADGCDGLVWSLKPNGVIYIKHCGESAAERAARGGLPSDVDAAPWTRLAPLHLGPLAALFADEPALAAHLHGSRAAFARRLAALTKHAPQRQTGPSPCLHPP